MDQLALIEALENHGMLLIKVVDDVVKDLDNTTRLEQYFTLLGHLHEKQRVPPQYMDLMGPIFCQTIRPVLTAEAQWDHEVRDAWLRLFRMMSIRMKSAYSAKGSHPVSPAGYHPLTGHAKPVVRVNQPLTAEGSPNGRLYQKHHRRRVSVDEVNERKVRLQAQHCHALPHQRRNLGGSVLSVIPDVHDYNRVSTEGRWLTLAQSHEDLRPSLTSPLSGSSAMLLKNASEAKAKASQERRSSLHQLVFGLRTQSSLDKGNHPGKQRKRSQSEGLLSKLAVNQG